MKISFANDEVLEFYKNLPFNFSSDATLAAANVMTNKHDIIKYYVPIADDILLDENIRVLEIGCGTGWLSSLLTSYYGCSVTGIDFNPVAIDQANKIKSSIGHAKDNPHFEVADLFLYDAPPFDVVISHGVLHHTNDCMEGIRKACSLTQKDGHIVIGLYNYFGRKPFLDYFKTLANNGATVEELFEIYKKIDGRHNHDDTLARSWFNDQVLHPHETQHTISEVLDVFSACGVKLIATSLDGYSSKPTPDIESIFEIEKQTYDSGLKAIEEGRYFTGYFVVEGEKTL